MGRLLILDASSLLTIERVTQPDCFNELLEEVTRQVQKGDFGFPKEVVAELKIIGRHEAVTRWSVGLGLSLRPYAAHFNDLANIMEIVADLGFDEGIEKPDGTEASLAYAAATAFRYHASGRDCCIVSEDTGVLPHRPSMEQLGSAFGCPMLRTREALLEMGLDGFLV
ncbi:hypothetical protein [Micromonospora chersina]|uniref:hypothetical protein n=1 Tax=Micromonospora chersina TaxID=47854 RepID=UPI003718A04F